MMLPMVRTVDRAYRGRTAGARRCAAAPRAGAARRSRRPGARAGAARRSRRPAPRTRRRSAFAPPGTVRPAAAILSALGAWRSLVARTVRVGEVPGSNPGAPIGRICRGGIGRPAGVVAVVASAAPMRRSRRGSGIGWGIRPFRSYDAVAQTLAVGRHPPSGLLQVTLVRETKKSDGGLPPFRRKDLWATASYRGTARSRSALGAPSRRFPEPGADRGLGVRAAKPRRCWFCGACELRR